jgi:hypothetical protein
LNFRSYFITTFVIFSTNSSHPVLNKLALLSRLLFFSCIFSCTGKRYCLLISHVRVVDRPRKYNRDTCNKTKVVVYDTRHHAACSLPGCAYNLAAPITCTGQLGISNQETTHKQKGKKERKSTTHMQRGPVAVTMKRERESARPRILPRYPLGSPTTEYRGPQPCVAHGSCTIDSAMGRDLILTRTLCRITNLLSVCTFTLARKNHVSFIPAIH